MTKRNEPLDLPVTFVALKDGEQAPRFAVYQLDTAGRPVTKLGGYDGKVLKIDLADARSVALGPDVEDFKALPKESLASYRVAQKIELWRKQGIVLPRDIWDRFHFHFACVTGTVRKCRPWFWDLLDDIRLKPMFELAQVARIKPITADLQPHILFPLRCQPLCDGIIEIYERECCCHHIHIPILIDRLRDILDILPIPIPDPFPDPIPGLDPAPFTPQFCALNRVQSSDVRRRSIWPPSPPKTCTKTTSRCARCRPMPRGSMCSSDPICFRSSATVRCAKLARRRFNLAENSISVICEYIITRITDIALRPTHTRSSN